MKTRKERAADCLELVSKLRFELASLVFETEDPEVRRAFQASWEAKLALTKYIKSCEEDIHAEKGI